MPELPEVETTRRGLEPHLVGRRVLELVVRQPRLRWPVPRALRTGLPGQRIEGIERRAKYLLVHTGPGSALLHLGRDHFRRRAGHPLAQAKGGATGESQGERGEPGGAGHGPARDIAHPIIEPHPAGNRRPLPPPRQRNDPVRHSRTVDEQAIFAAVRAPAR